MLSFRTANIVAMALVAAPALHCASAAAMPTASTAASLARVQAVTATIHAAEATALAPAPPGLDADLRSLLDKYQPDADVAASNATVAGLLDFPNQGLCSQDYPCFSVSRVGMVGFDSSIRLAVSPADALLQTILGQDVIALDQASNPRTILSGTKIGTSELTLEVIAPVGSIRADRLAGSVFDLLKAQGLQGTLNAVRGMGVGGGPNGKSPMALCVFPAGMEGTAAANFCHGKELDGTLSSVSTGETGQLRRRFSLVGLAAGICSIIDIPLICPSEEK